MSRWSECVICSTAFEYAGRGRIPRACPDHVDEWRRQQSRRRTERWAFRKVAELSRSEDG